jgi:hypothetical protein
MRLRKRAGADEPLSCREFVELVTDYLEGALDRWTEGRFVLHATQCPGCETYLDQFRETIRVAGRLTPEDIDPVARDRLLAEFATWKRGSGGDDG